MRNRLSILALLVLTAAAAIYVARGGDTVRVWLVAYFALALSVLWSIAYFWYWLRTRLARRWVPWFMDHRTLWLAEKLFGLHLVAVTLNDRAVQHIERGELELARQLLDRALELTGSEVNIWRNRATTHFHSQRYPETVADASEALELDESNEIVRALRGLARVLQGEHALGLDDLQQIKCTGAQHYDVAWYRGMAHEVLKHWREAMQDYLLAAELDRQRLEAATGLVRLQASCPVEELRDGRKALENANLLCDRTQGKDWVVISVLAAAHAECADFDSAIKYAQTAHELAPEEEKPERLKRIDQYQRSEPYRLPM